MSEGRGEGVMEPLGGGGMDLLPECSGLKHRPEVGPLSHPTTVKGPHSRGSRWQGAVLFHPGPKSWRGTGRGGNHQSCWGLRSGEVEAGGVEAAICRSSACDVVPRGRERKGTEADVSQ